MTCFFAQNSNQHSESMQSTAATSNNRTQTWRDWAASQTHDIIISRLVTCVIYAIHTLTNILANFLLLAVMYKNWTDLQQTSLMTSRMCLPTHCCLQSLPTLPQSSASTLSARDQRPLTPRLRADKHIHNTDLHRFISVSHWQLSGYHRTDKKNNLF